MSTEAPPTELDAALIILQDKVRRALDYSRELKSVDLKPKTVQHEIDGIVYTSTKLPLGTGIEVGSRVSVILGQSLFRMISIGEGAIFQADLITPIATRIVQDGGMSLVRLLMSRTKVNRYQGQPGSKGGDLNDAIDEHFSGEYGHLLKVCFFVLAHNFRGPTLGVH